MNQTKRSLRQTGVSLVARRALLQGLAPVALGLMGCGDPPRVAPTPDAARLEKALFARVNADRKARGLTELLFDEQLSDAARIHAADMHDNRFFAHDSQKTGSLDDRLRSIGYGAAVARENLAEAPDADRAQDGLLLSPGHLANIVATDVTHLGIGAVAGGVADPQNVLFVQVFARPVAKESGDQASAAILQKIQEARKQRGMPPLPTHPKLSSIAAARSDELPDDMAGPKLEALGKAALGDLSSDSGGLGGLSVTAARVLASTEYEVPSAAFDPSVKGIGISAEVGQDEKKNRVIKVLVLLGR